MRVKLEELVEEVSERTTINNQHPVLTSSRSGIYLQEDYFKKQVASKDNTGYKVIRKGEFTYRAMSDTGEFYPNKLECTNIGIVSPAYPVFKIKDNRILPDYLKYYFKSRLFQKSITAFVQGSTRASMKFGKMKSISIDLPDKDKQNQILNIIEILESTIDKYKLEIDYLDNLIKARFVEMFDNFEKVNLSDLAIVTMGQSPTSDSYNDSGDGLPFFQGKADYGDKYTIVRHYTNKPTKIVEYGTVLMSVRAPVGPVNIASEKCCLGRGLCGINAKPEVSNNEFIFNAIRAMENEISQKGTGSTFKAISKTDILEIKVPQAPIQIQNKFADFVTQVDKSKFAISTTQYIYDEILLRLSDSLWHNA